MKSSIAARPSPFSSLFAVACAVAFVACSEVPRRRGEAVQTVASDKLATDSPVEVVVAPIENATGNSGVPLAMLRDAFQQGLVRRRYSPLALEYVDRKVVDATYAPGSLQEQAVLLVNIETWDTSLFETRGALVVKARARLVDARNPANGQLWSGAVDHRFDLEAEREKFSTSETFLRYACGQVADEILAALPARNTAPGG